MFNKLQTYRGFISSSISCSYWVATIARISTKYFYKTDINMISACAGASASAGAGAATGAGAGAGASGYLVVRVASD